MEQLATALQNVIASTQENAPFLLKFIGLLWLIHLVNWATKYHLNALGIRPRTGCGLLGIIFAPFLHGHFNHIFFNTIPLFVLGSLVLANGYTLFYTVSIITILLGGLLTWTFGRKAVHIGASTLVMGYFGYLLANVYYNFNITTIILAVICVYYFGGLIIALFPGKKEVSWESHVFGFIAGVAASYAYPTIFVILQILQGNPQH